VDFLNRNNEQAIQLSLFKDNVDRTFSLCGDTLHLSQVRADLAPEFKSVVVSRVILSSSYRQHANASLAEQEKQGHEIGLPLNGTMTILPFVLPHQTITAVRCR